MAIPLGGMARDLSVDDHNKPESPKRVSSSVKTALIIFGGVVLYFLVGTLFRGEEGASNDDENERLPFTVLVRDISGEARPETIVLSGRTEAARRIMVRAETPGQVERIVAPEGSQVSSGETLCRLDADSRRETLAEAEAARQSTATDLAAAEKLYAEGFASEAALNQARAAKESAEAGLARARDDYRNIDIKAPFDGLVAEMLVEPGDVLAVGTPCAVLADLSAILIAGGIPAKEAARVSPGDSAKIHLPDGPTFDAELRFVSDVADPATRTFRVELVGLDAPDLPEGVEVRAHITAGNRPAALIPRNSLVYSDDGVLGVRIIEPTGASFEDLPGATVSFRPVTLLDEADNGAWVSGLGDSSMLIIRGQDYVSHGITVTYKEDDGA